MFFSETFTQEILSSSLNLIDIPIPGKSMLNFFVLFLYTWFCLLRFFFVLQVISQWKETGSKQSFISTPRSRQPKLNLWLRYAIAAWTRWYSFFIVKVLMIPRLLSCETLINYRSAPLVQFWGFLPFIFRCVSPVFIKTTEWWRTWFTSAWTHCCCPPATSRQQGTWSTWWWWKALSPSTAGGPFAWHPALRGTTESLIRLCMFVPN